MIFIQLNNINNNYIYYIKNIYVKIIAKIINNNIFQFYSFLIISNNEITILIKKIVYDLKHPHLDI